jgi:molybdenum cofactor synthesis domain-containing protein
MRVDAATEKFFSLINWSKLEPAIEGASLLASHGRVLAKDIITPFDIPSFAKASMDGYAIRSKDVATASDKEPVILAIIGKLSAGEAMTYEIRDGEALSIATGARLPMGADAVVMSEHTRLRGSDVKIFNKVKSGENVSLVGEDMKKGRVMLKNGRWLASQDVGLLATIGLDKVPVFRKPRVAIIATGSELVEPGGRLDRTSIFESNRYMISCMVQECGAEPIDLGLCKDDRPAISSRLKEAAEYDMVVVCGGTSVGPTDYVPELVNAMGKPGLVVHGVAMKPGSPTGLGIVNGRPVILVPGFPVSAFVAFYTFGRPVLQRILQTSGPAKANPVAKLTKSVRVHAKMRTFIRVKVTRISDSLAGGYAAEPISAAGARLLSTLVDATGMVIVDDREMLRKGEKVEVIPFRSID